MPERKVNFPRLKSFSQPHSEPNMHPPAHLATLQPSCSHQHHIRLQQNATSISAVSRNKLPHYHYISKSPSYFKHKEVSTRNINTLSIRTDADQSIQAYLETHSRGLDKQFLLQIARNRVKTIQKKKNKGQIMSTDSRVRTNLDQGTILDQLHRMKESKYENFRPMRFPMERAIAGHKKQIAVG